MSSRFKWAAGALNINIILQEIEAKITRETKIWVAYSGGLDSTVLLHILGRSDLSQRIRAIHINHQLSPNAGSWQRHCEAFACGLGLPFASYAVDVSTDGRGLENAARDARYSIFKKIIEPKDVLLLAHHADDALETLLFRLMRGSGLKGLAGMEYQRSLGSGILIRPLLEVSQADLLEYAKQNALQWVEDESNHNGQFDRNYLRNAVIPQIKKRWPAAPQKALQATSHLRNSVALMAEYGEEDLATCGRRKERLGESTDLTRLQTFSPSRQVHLIRTWADLLAYSLPSQAQLLQLTDIIQAPLDASPVLGWGACELRRYQNRLYLIPRSAIEQGQVASLSWDLGAQRSVALAGGWSLEALDWFNGEQNSEQTFPLEIRSRNSVLNALDGEPLRCQPVQRTHSQTLKKLLYEYHLEPWLRPIVPLVYYKGELVAVADLWLCRLANGENNPLVEPKTGESNNVPFQWVFSEKSSSI